MSDESRRDLLICVNRSLRGDMPSCAGRGSEALARSLQTEIDQRKLPYRVERIRCFGFCSRGPNLRVVGGPFWHHAGEGDLARILDWLEQGAGDISPTPPVSSRQNSDIP